MNSVIIWSTAVITISGALAVVWKLLKPIVYKVKAFSESVNSFLRDWNGEDSREGRDKVPGVMERLNRIDGELKHNGGSSMKDSQKRIEQTLKKIDERLEEGNRKFDELETRVSRIEREK